MHFLNNHSALSSAQHGFRQVYSCGTQLVEFFHDVTRAVDNKQKVDCLFLDIKKVFDSVCHDGIIRKLKSFGIQCSIIL